VSDGPSTSLFGGRCAIDHIERLAFHTPGEWSGLKSRPGTFGMLVFSYYFQPDRVRAPGLCPGGWAAGRMRCGVMTHEARATIRLRAGGQRSSAPMAASPAPWRQRAR
jgi:hypothetical protein